MSKIEYQNWSTEIFQGFYESELYNSDTEYSFNTTATMSKGMNCKTGRGLRKR